MFTLLTDENEISISCFKNNFDGIEFHYALKPKV